MSAWRSMSVIFPPVGCQNLAIVAGQAFQAARSYSLMRPPRTGRRLIFFWERSATGWSGRGGCSWRAAGMPLGSLADTPGADLGGLTLDRPGRPAARAVWLDLVAVACAGDDQEVLVNPADLGAGQAGQEGCDGRAQLFGGVEGEGGVVASLGLGLEPPGGAGARVPEGLGRDHGEPAGSLDGVSDRGLAVQALLVLGETREVTAPDRSRVLLRGAGVDEQPA